MEKFKVYLYTGIVIIIIVVVIYFYGKKIGEKANTTALPEDTVWGKDVTTSESNIIVRLADDLKKDMTGLDFSLNRDDKIYKELAAQSDRILVAVANQFQTRYKESLLSWLEDENFNWSSFALQGLVDGVIERLKRNKVQ